MSSGGIPAPVTPAQVPLPRIRPSNIGPLAMRAGSAAGVDPSAQPAAAGSPPRIPPLGGVGSTLGDVASGISGVTPYSSPIAAFAEGFAGAQKARLDRQDKERERERQDKADARADQRDQWAEEDRGIAAEDRAYQRKQDADNLASAGTKRTQDLENQVAERTTQYATATKPKEGGEFGAPMDPQARQAWLDDVNRFRQDLRKKLGLPADGAPADTGIAPKGDLGGTPPGSKDDDSLLGTGGAPATTSDGSVATGTEVTKTPAVKPASIKGSGKTPDDPISGTFSSKQDFDAKVPMGAYYLAPNGTLLKRTR